MGDHTDGSRHMQCAKQIMDKSCNIAQVRSHS